MGGKMFNPYSKFSKALKPLDSYAFFCLRIRFCKGWRVPLV